MKTQSSDFPPHPLGALFLHLHTSLLLNFRNRQAMAYGYVMPLLFLLSFAGLFRSGVPPLLGQMGQLLTLGILGGACFGMPTGLVADRERGLWRRYRLLPVAPGALLLSTLLARILILASAALLQLLAARLLFGTPLPLHPLSFIAAFLFVSCAFLGLGLLVAAFANNVPAVQALGQCLFLPMVILGSVGVPLELLPDWARHAAGYMPGRYAVELLDAAYASPRGLQGSAYHLLALGLIGLASALIGLRCFRWEARRRLDKADLRWLGLALGLWLLVGLSSSLAGKTKPFAARGGTAADISLEDIRSVSYENLPEDDGLVTRLAPRFHKNEIPEAAKSFAQTLETWAPARQADSSQAIQQLLSVASLADLAPDLREAEIARIVFMQLKRDFDRDTLHRTLTWIALNPGAGSVPSSLPELGLPKSCPVELVHQRNALYARKFLGRLLDQIPD